MFIGTNRAGIYRSTDRGNTWIHVGLAEITVHSIIALDRYLLAAGQELVYSADNGGNWLTANFKYNDASLVAYSPTGDIFVQTWSNGLHRGKYK